MVYLWLQWNIAKIEITLWTQRNIPARLISPIEKAWFCERFFFEMVTVIVKCKKDAV